MINTGIIQKTSLKRLSMANQTMANHKRLQSQIWFEKNRNCGARIPCENDWQSTFHQYLYKDV